MLKWLLIIESSLFYVDKNTWKSNLKSELSLVLGRKIEATPIASEVLEKALITNYRKNSNEHHY